MGVKIFSRGFYVSRILCTGNAGFIGSHIVEGLLNQGHTVIGVDDLSGGFLENLPTHRSPNFHRFQFYKRDICDYRAMEEIFMGHKPEVVVHLAASAREGASWLDLHKITRSNIFMSSILIELAIKYKTSKFVFFSSMAAYGHNKGKAAFSEDTKLSPCDPYGVSKTCTEMTLRMMSKAHGMPFVVIRPHNVFGERQSLCDPFRNFIGISMNRLMRCEDIVLFGEGHIRAFSYIFDSLPAFIKATESGVADGETINVGGKESVQVAEAAREILKHFPEANQTIRLLPPRYGEVEVAYSTFDKSERLLGYEEKIGWREGIARMAVWAHAQGAKTWRFEPLALHADWEPDPWKALAEEPRGR